jgi:CheY-like chemotaxis protein
MKSGHEMLVVEDSLSVCALIKTHLEKAGHVVHTASSDEGAISVLEAKKIDFVLCDILIESKGAKTGYHVLKYIKQSPKLSQVPVVIMTQKRDAGTAKTTAERLGSNGFLHKPFEMKELDEVIQQLLK